MKVVQLTAENVKRLKAVDITPEGSVQVVTGRNAQGKTSVLDAIWLALGGGAAQRGTATTRPIRDGADEAKATVDLGDLTVTRKWTEKGTTLTVRAADGTTYNRPQEVLDALVGRLSFDPLAFVGLDDKAQVSQLMGLVYLPFDPVELDRERATLYDKRHQLGQERTRARGAFESLPTPDPDLPTAEVSSGPILAAYEGAQAIARDNEGKRRDHTDALAVYEVEVRATEAAREALRLAEERERDASAKVERTREVVAALPPDPDLEPFREQLAEVEAVNGHIRDASAWYRAKATADAADADWKALSEEIEAIDARKTDGLAAATFPVPGLGFGDGGVTYNDLPFRQASGAEQLRVSLAMAMALNPKLRVVLIRDGSLLDSENMAMLETMATDGDFQVWVERVEDARETAVVIEDGKVAS